MKKIISVCLVIVLILSSFVCYTNAATFDDINKSDVFVKQQTNYTCTLAAAVMMLRRYAIIRGDSNWSNITESSIRSVAWLENAGLYHTFSINKTNGGSISVGYASIPSGDRTTVLKNLLDSHPEGIVIYNTSYPHAVLLTDYTNGIFYCSDPASNAAYGRIPLSNATCNVTLNTVSVYWYVASPRVYLNDTKYRFDVNINVDGTAYNSGFDGVTFDVYINGKQVANDVADYCVEHESGSSYTVNDIKVNGCYRLNGNSSYSGTITGITGINIPIVTNHSWDSGRVTKAASYFVSGKKMYTCTKCGTTRTESIDRLNVPSSPEIVASVTDNGHTYYLYASNMNWTDAKNWCENNCGHLVTITSSYEQSVIDSLIGSNAESSFWIGAENKTTGIYRWVTDEYWNYENWAEGEPDNSFGDTEHYAGTYKGTTWADFREISTTPRGFIFETGDNYVAHSWNSGVITKAATCKTTGIRTYTCTVCGGTKTETIAKTNNHTWNNGVVTKQPTTTSEGIKTYTCSVCGDTKTESIPKLTESAVDTNTVKEKDGVVYAALGLNAQNVISAAGTGAKILKADGKELKSTEKVGSGMTLVKPNGTKETIIVKGDNNGDGEVSTADARFALRTAVGLENPNAWEKNASEVDGNSGVSTSDARLILRTAVGLDKLALY